MPDPSASLDWSKVVVARRRFGGEQREVGGRRGIGKWSDPRRRSWKQSNEEEILGEKLLLPLYVDVVGSCGSLLHELSCDELGQGEQQDGELSGDVMSHCWLPT